MSVPHPICMQCSWVSHPLPFLSRQFSDIPCLKLSPKADGANSDSKQIYFQRGKTHNFLSATSPQFF